MSYDPNQVKQEVQLNFMRFFLVPLYSEIEANPRKCQATPIKTSELQKPLCDLKPLSSAHRVGALSTKKKKIKPKP